MAELRCVDGSVLGVHPQPVLDRDGMPYEVTLRLTRDGAEHGAVGERCGWFLATTASRLREARAEHGEDAFPPSSLESGVRAWALAEEADGDERWAAAQRYLPRDRELFAFRSRDPDDLATAGELRAVLHEQRVWRPGARGGSWSVDRRVVVEAWGASGIGVRAVLTSTQLLAFLDDLLGDFAAVGASYGGESGRSGEAGQGGQTRRSDQSGSLG